MIDIKAKPHCCEEASPASHSFYIPCNQPATKIVMAKNNEGPYRMCDMCADHNIRNRGATLVGPYVPPAPREDGYSAGVRAGLVKAAERLEFHCSRHKNSHTRTVELLAVELKSIADTLYPDAPALPDARAGAVEPVAWLQRHRLGPLHLSSPENEESDDWSKSFPVYAAAPTPASIATDGSEAGASKKFTHKTRHATLSEFLDMTFKFEDGELERVEVKFEDEVLIMSSDMFFAVFGADAHGLYEQAVTEMQNKELSS